MIGKCLFLFSARIDEIFEEEIARREYEVRQAEAQAQAESVRSTEGGNLQQHQDKNLPSSGIGLPQQQSGEVAATETGNQCVPQLPSSPLIDGNAPESAASPTDSSSVEAATGRSFFKFLFINLVKITLCIIVRIFVDQKLL